MIKPARRAFDRRSRSDHHSLVLIAVAAGVIAAWKTRHLDRPLRRGTLGGRRSGTGVFVIGYVLIQIFAIDRRWPAGAVLFGASPPLRPVPRAHHPPTFTLSFLMSR